MGLLDFIFGGDHPIVRQARNSQSISTEVDSVFYRYNRRDDEFDVGVIHGANSRRLVLRSYDTEGDADHAAGCLADYLGVGIVE